MKLIPIIIACCPQCQGPLYIERSEVLCWRSSQPETLISSLCAQEADMTPELREHWARAARRATAWADREQSRTFTGAA